MSHTSIGNFPIGFRRGGGAWQKDLPALCGWARQNGFEFLDIGAEAADCHKTITAAGLGIGSVDLPTPWELLASADAAKRNAAADRAAELIHAWSAVGVKIFFCVVFPEDPLRPRAESMKLAGEGYGRLCQAISGTGAKIAVEGYPGGWPHYSALAAAPEGYRALFQAVGSDAMGVNYDPSHLIRMGIDPLRFLREFSSRVWHVHAKDTALLPEGLYDCGNLQPAVHAKPHRWGGQHWRYTIPGAGNAPWVPLLQLLQERGYQGRISVELEDENFNGSEEGEKRGLLESLKFLSIRAFPKLN